MAKALGSWSAMRRYLEEEMLAGSLRGRVQYSCTTFKNMDGCHVFEIRIDGKTAQQFSFDMVASRVYEGVRPIDKNEFWQGLWNEKKKAFIDRRFFDDMDFAAALREYRSLPITSSMHSGNPLVRMFAVLDRRMGKRTLLALAETLNSQPEWLRYFYKLRMRAEHILCDV
ncbi:MAG: hypothetical protein LBS36_04380 [Oscillospiraceae bacterium]|jgi:hypothetical protein|nr:hypothetical protein [Oscillospiraceae bacterium]